MRFQIRGEGDDFGPKRLWKLFAQFDKLKETWKCLVYPFTKPLRDSGKKQGNAKSMSTHSLLGGHECIEVYCKP